MSKSDLSAGRTGNLLQVLQEKGNDQGAGAQTRRHEQRSFPGRPNQCDRRHERGERMWAACAGTGLLRGSGREGATGHAGDHHDGQGSEQDKGN